jgi:hypothetical protein
MSYDTADQIYGPDPNAASTTGLAGPGTVPAAVPAVVDPNMRGLMSMHPQYSPTPWVIGLALLLVLLLHPRAGFNVRASAGH